MISPPPSQASQAPASQAAPMPPSPLAPSLVPIPIPFTLGLPVSFDVDIKIEFSPSVRKVNVDASVKQGHEQLSLELDAKADYPRSRNDETSNRNRRAWLGHVKLALAAGKTEARTRYVTSRVYRSNERTEGELK